MLAITLVFWCGVALTLIGMRLIWGGVIRAILRRRSRTKRVKT